MTSLPAPSEICSVSGYDRAAFASGKTIIILENGDVKHVDFAEEQPILKSMKLLGRVTALSVSNDFSIFAVAIEEENVAKVVVYSLELAIGEEKAVYGTQYLSTEMCISQAAEVWNMIYDFFKIWNLGVRFFFKFKVLSQFIYKNNWKVFN